MDKSLISKELVNIAGLLSSYIKRKAGVAEEILRQIKAIDRMALAAWGANNFISSGRGVSFKVKGPKCKVGCAIAIDLAGDDTYIVTLRKVKKTKDKEMSDYLGKAFFTDEVVDVKTVKRVYVENLVQVIDNLVG